MAQPWKDLDKQDRRTNSSLTREPATSLRGKEWAKGTTRCWGPGRPITGCSDPGEHCRGQWWLPAKASGISRAQGGGTGGAKRTKEDWLCVSGTQALEPGSLLQDLHRRLFSALISLPLIARKVLLEPQLKSCCHLNLHIRTKDFPLEAQSLVLTPRLMLFWESFLNKKLHSDTYCMTLGKTFISLYLKCMEWSALPKVTGLLWSYNYQVGSVVSANIPFVSLYLLLLCLLAICETRVCYLAEECTSRGSPPPGKVKGNWKCNNLEVPLRKINYYKSFINFWKITSVKGYLHCRY